MYTNAYGIYTTPSVAYHSLTSAIANQDLDVNQVRLLVSEPALNYFATPQTADVPEGEEPEFLPVVETRYWAKLLETVPHSSIDLTDIEKAEDDIKDALHMYRVPLENNRFVLLIKQDA